MSVLLFFFFCFFFSSRRRHTRWPRDWSSDVCSSDLLVLHATLLGKLAYRRFLFRRELLGDLNVDLDVLIAPPAVPLDPLAGDAELLAVLGAGRHLEHHALPVERAHLDLRAEEGLRQIDRNHADHVEPLAPEEPVGLDLNHHDDVAAALGALPLEPQPRAVFGPGRNSDRETLLLTDLAGPLAGRAALRGYLAPSAAHGARPLHGEATLAERDGPAPPAFGAGRERRPGRAARAATRRADFGQRERDGNLAAQRRNPERNRDRRLDLVLVLEPGPGAAPSKDRREQVSEPAERAKIG